MAVPRDADAWSKRLVEFLDRLKARPVAVAVFNIAVGTIIGAVSPKLARRLDWRRRITSPRDLVRGVLWAVALQALALWLKERTEAYKRRLDDFVRRHGRNPTDEEARRLWSGGAD